MSKHCHCCNGTGMEASPSDDLRLARYMRNLREKQGISGRELARLIGVKEAYISMLESGKRRFTTNILEGYRVHCDPNKPKNYYLSIKQGPGTLIFGK